MALKRTCALSAATALVMIGAGFTAPTAALAADAAPILDTASIAPAGELNWNGISNNVYTPSVTSGTNGWYIDETVTLRLSATDDVAVSKFVVQVGAEAPVDVPATATGTAGTAEFPITGDRAATTVTYSAVDSAGNVSDPKTVSVRIDTQNPSLAFPGTETGKIAQSAPAIVPTRADATPGSGGAAVREAWIDGEATYPLPLDPSKLSIGQHTWALVVGDAASNAAKYTLTFEITTSFADARALIARYVAAGSVSTSNGARLDALLTDAEAAADAPSLELFAEAVDNLVPRGTERDALAGAASWLIDDANGVEAPVIATGVAVEDAQGMDRYPFTLPGESVVHEDAAFKVLAFAPRQGAFRHEHVPFTEAMIQDLGRENGFDVDVWDYMSPDVSVAGNPFESIERLSQYDAIVGVSSVGNDMFNVARPTVADPSVTVDEQAVLMEYIAQGGGMVAIHGATDSMHGWEWYKELVGGEFGGHGGNAQGQQNYCGSCNVAELVTEDGTHPATQHFEKTTMIRDELYNWQGFLPREKVHVLQTLTEASYVGGIGASAGTVEGDDHPISWCQNYEGGRAFTQALMHNWQNSDNPLFQTNILEGIKWVAGQTEANCVTHNEIGKILDGAGGEISAGALATMNARLDASYNAYFAKNYGEALAQAQLFRSAVATPGAGSDDLIAGLQLKAEELVAWMDLLRDDTPALGFMTQPASSTATIDDVATFLVEASGDDVSYQWQRKAPGATSWTNIVGETSFALAVDAVDVGQSGTQYRVRISNVTGEQNSNAVTLTVEAPIDVTVVVKSQCLAGKAYTAVTAKNAESAGIAIDIETPYGAKSFASVAAGKSASASFNSRTASIDAGQATVAATAVIDGETVNFEQVVGYSAINCG